jgi:magnesium-transporting ATPase (P-type)
MIMGHDQNRPEGHVSDSNDRPRWHALDADDALERLKSNQEGLDRDEAKERLERHGPNRLPDPERSGPLQRFLLQFHNVLIYILIVAGIGTALLGHWMSIGSITPPLFH